MIKVGDKIKNIKEISTSVFDANKNDKFLLYRHKSNSPSPGHDEYLFASGNTLDELFDNWIEVMRRGGYGYSGNALENQKRIFKQNKLKYWSRPASFYTLKINNKMKNLTTEQKNKVRKFIKQLTEVKYYRFSQDKESSDLLYKFQKNVNSECDSIKRGDDANMKTWQTIKQMVTLIINDIQEFDSDRKMESKKTKNTLKENNTYTMLSALRDILDDLMLNTEMLIDNKYGKVDHEEFKKEWYRFSNTFENKFKGIQKNLISATKQKG